MGLKKSRDRGVFNSTFHPRSVVGGGMVGSEASPTMGLNFELSSGSSEVECFSRRLWEGSLFNDCDTKAG